MDLSMASMLFGVRALVVKEWTIDPNADVPIRIKARKSGLIAWLMSLLKLDTTTVFELHGNHVSLSEGSLAGQLREIVPLTGACNMGTGYLKPFAYVLAAVSLAFWAMISMAGDTGNEFAVAWQFVSAIVCLIAYFLNKSLVLYVTPVSGSTLRIAFKRSLIEGVNVDEEQSRKVVALIREYVMGSVRKQTPPLLTP